MFGLTDGIRRKYSKSKDIPLPPDGGHPHQSKIGSEEPIFDSFSLKGEAFGRKRNLLQQNEQCWIRDKASPLGEKLSAIGSSEPMAD